MSFVLAYTTCSAEEADSLSDSLLNEKLIACAKKVPVDAQYWWKGATEQAQEVMLLLETLESKLPDIEAHFKTVHSYDTFVLAAMPLVYVSDDAKAWLKEVIGK